MSSVFNPSIDPLFQEAYHSWEGLTSVVECLYEFRSLTISQLRIIIRDLHKCHLIANIVKVGGASVGIAGGVLSVIGFALIPVSFGASTVLAIAGSATAAAGGMATSGTVAVEFGISKHKIIKAQAAYDADIALVKIVREKWPSFERRCQKLTEEIEKACKCKEEKNNAFMEKLMRAWIQFKKIAGSKHVKSALFVWSIFILGKGAARLIATSWDVFQVIILGVELSAINKGLFARIATWLIGSRVYFALDVFFCAGGLVLDIVTLISTLIDMYHGSKSKAALELEKKVDKLEAEQRMWAEAFLQDKYSSELAADIQVHVQSSSNIVQPFTHSACE